MSDIESDGLCLHCGADLMLESKLRSAESAVANLKAELLGMAALSAVRASAWVKCSEREPPIQTVLDIVMDLGNSPFVTIGHCDPGIKLRWYAMHPVTVSPMLPISGDGIVTHWRLRPALPEVSDE